MSFTPTALLIKEHTVTGLKYFCKTTRLNDLDLYKGSGKHWKRHLRKHGTTITTGVLGVYYEQDRCVSAALAFSEQNDIVKSKLWANEKPENGLDGWPPGTPNPRNVPQSVETRAKRSKTLKGTDKAAHYGADNGNYGKPMPEERKAKMRATKAANPTAKPWTEERRAKVAETWARKLAATLNT